MEWGGRASPPGAGSRRLCLGPGHTAHRGGRLSHTDLPSEARGGGHCREGEHAPPVPFPLLTHTASHQQSPCPCGSPWSSGTSLDPSGKWGSPAPILAPVLAEDLHQLCRRSGSRGHQMAPSVPACHWSPAVPGGPAQLQRARRWHVVTEIVQAQATWPLLRRIGDFKVVTGEHLASVEPCWCGVRALHVSPAPGPVRWAWDRISVTD